MKCKMVMCASPVNKDAVSRRNISGIEHIIVSSFTLPDNVVMNGGLYPAEEIEKSFLSLERTLAPVEHPQDNQGNYISASDPEAIHNFHAGAFNVNVSRENGRVHIQKHINVQEALKTERGKRLLDRIEEIETNDSPRPVHTSVGVFLSVEEHDSPQTNEAGEEYTWTARDMFFDHDAILLDSIGAATPGDGVGMAVNSNGDKIEVETIVVNGEEEQTNERVANDLRTNVEGPSFASISEQIQQAINGIVTSDWMWLVDVFDDQAIFETNQGYFSVPWAMMNSRAELTGIPIRVDRNVTYQPKVNKQTGGTDAMFKEMVVNALTEAGIETEGLSDEELVAKYNEMLKANEEPTDDNLETVVANAVAKAVTPLTEEISTLKSTISANADAERDGLAELVGNSDKFPGMTKEAALKLSTEELKELAANCGNGHGVCLDFQGNHDDTTYQAPEKMPGDES